MVSHKMKEWSVDSVYPAGSYIFHSQSISQGTARYTKLFRAALKITRNVSL